MQIKELILGIPVLMFVLWIFMAPLPQQRIERACSPIEWVGNVATSSTALTTQDNTATAMKWSDKLNYSCQYMIWRLFYQKQYNEAVQKGLVKPDQSQVQAGEQSLEHADSSAEVKDTPDSEVKE